MKNILPVLSIVPLLACAEIPHRAETPTMGWSSWNTYRVNISADLIMHQADLLKSLGLDKCGYTYINIDDGFFGGRDANGRLKPHPKRFPDGLTPVVEHIHSLGLKAGIYSDGGENTCGCYWDKDELGKGVGFWQHDLQDADFFFKDHDFDFIKIDFCGGQAYDNTAHEDMDERERYTAIRQAIDSVKKGVRINVCRWDYPGTWVREIGSSWRISHDINPTWGCLKDIIKQSLYLHPYAAPGAYNDMDMLEVGRGLSPDEDYTHFALWCMMSSPLLIGCDLQNLVDKPDLYNLLSNRRLIALDQDTAAPQSYVAKREGDALVLVRDVKVPFGLERAFALVNLSDKDHRLSFDFADIDLGGETFAITDLKDGAERTVSGKNFAATLRPHETQVYIVKAPERLERRIYEAEDAFLTSYQELHDAEKAHTGTYVPMSEASGGMVAGFLGGRADNDLVWEQVWSKNGGSYSATIHTFAEEDGELSIDVNGIPCKMAKVSPAKASVVFDVTLRPGINRIRIHNDSAPLPPIDRMDIAPQR
ncbi:MAG: alpha-galactosidase [Kiritimatiellae bacterium]|nr:alpha-galactosidase [Kiritimatiellia bacterium]